MSTSKVNGKVLAFVLAALIFLFAPLVHAMCVGQTHNATATHVMPGGSTMAMTEIKASSSNLEIPVISPDAAMVPNLSIFDSEADNGFASSSGLGGELILVALIAACLAPALRSLHRLRRALRVSSDFLRANFRQAALGLRPPPIFHRPTMVDLVSLGISRT